MHFFTWHFWCVLPSSTSTKKYLFHRKFIKSLIGHTLFPEISNTAQCFYTLVVWGDSCLFLLTKGSKAPSNFWRGGEGSIRKGLPDDWPITYFNANAKPCQMPWARNHKNELSSDSHYCCCCCNFCPGFRWQKWRNHAFCAKRMSRLFLRTDLKFFVFGHCDVTVSQCHSSSPTTWGLIKQRHQ